MTWAIKKIRGIFFLVVFLLTIRPAYTQQSSNVLPEEAQDALKKGVLAAQNQDYKLATRYFLDARKITNAPEIFYNLGLAESQIPGRELRAICWFGAFLAAQTNSPKAQAIWDKIDALEVRNQANLSRFIQILRDVAGQQSIENGRDIDLVRVAWVSALNGEFDEALSISEKYFTGNGYTRSEIQSGIVESQLEAGDFAEAQKTANAIHQDGDQEKNMDWKRNADHLIADEKARLEQDADWNSTYVYPRASKSWCWVYDLDQEDSNAYDGKSFGLHSPLFLDLNGYVKSMSSRLSVVDDKPIPDDSHALVAELERSSDKVNAFYNCIVSAEKLIRAKNYVESQSKRLNEFIRLKRAVPLSHIPQNPYE